MSDLLENNTIGNFKNSGLERKELIRETNEECLKTYSD